MFIVYFPTFPYNKLVLYVFARMYVFCLVGFTTLLEWKRKGSKCYLIKKQIEPFLHSLLELFKFLT